MKKRIYIDLWLDLKPYDKQAKTDFYYLKVCNDVKKAITNHKSFLVLDSLLDKKAIDILACFLTSYFEDLISETNIWNTFIAKHKKLYGKQLPFYNLGEYYEEEINVQDVRFLIWYFLNTLNDELYISPFKPIIIETAKSVMEVFDQAWDYAPENKHLKTFYQIDKQTDDFYKTRNVIDTLLFRTYLFYPDTLQKLIENVAKTFEQLKNKQDFQDLTTSLNEVRDNTLHNIHTQLLSLKGKEWVSEMIQNHQLKQDLLNISPKISGLFLYKGQDNKYIYLEHIASGKKIDLLKESYDFSDELKEINTILYFSMVKWKNEWWFSGMSFQLPYKDEIIKVEKSSLESKKNVSFLDYEKEKVSEILNLQLETFLEYNNGEPIAFLFSDEIDEFLSGYYDLIIRKSSKKLSRKERKRLEKKRKAFKINKTHDFSENSETALIFFNPKSGIEIAFDINSAFPLPSNLFYKDEESEDDVMDLLMGEDYSKELAMYCIDNCKDKLSFFQNEDGKELLNDLDFMLRFWKNENYHSKPEITFT